jgi:hypothetical protein
VIAVAIVATATILSQLAVAYDRRNRMGNVE